jgi:glucose/arabinose dehydrogenase
VEQTLETAGGSANLATTPAEVPPTLPLDPAQPHEPPPAVAVPGYEVLGLLGRGGMGVVWKARQVGLNRVVALKMILHAGLAGPAERQRFQAEAEAVARLSHPNIVQVYEVGTCGETPYFSLEFCPGGSLAGQLDGTPWPAPRAAELVQTLARAMQAAHEARVIHRDLKPANVLRAADGSYKVSDFGLAKRLDERGGTQTGAILGTPSYMPPEQAGGKAREAGPAADVYALGAMLYELLTGRPPFRGATPMETVLQVMSEEPVPVCRLQGRAPRDLETVCAKCLQKDPRRRYPSAGELADDLGRFLEGRPVRARAVGPGERLYRWALRNPAVASLSAALALLLVTAAVGGTLAAFRFRDLAHKERDLLVEVSEDNDKLRAGLYYRNVSLAGQELYALNRQGAERILETCPADLRRFEWYLARQVCRGRPVGLVADDVALVESIAFHPAGRLLAASGASRTAGKVKIWDTVERRVVHDLAGHGAGLVHEVAFSPDGRLLASVCHDQTARVWDVETGRLLCTFREHTGWVGSVAFSPDGRSVATSGEDGTVRLWPPQTGEVLHTLKGHTKAARRVRFSPDGRLVASAGWDRTLRLWDAETGQPVRMMEGNAQLLGAAFSPDGRFLATAGGVGRRSEVRLWDAASRVEVFTRRGHSDMSEIVAFSPDSRLLASVSGHPDLTDQGEVKLWDVESGQEVFSFTPHEGAVRCVAFRPDGKMLATCGDRTVYLWDGSPVEE